MFLDEGMSGERFAIDGVSMAAKTGTGEIYNVEQGKYDTVNYTSSVMAAAPAEDPKIMVYWGMIGPNYEAYSAKQFQDIMRAALIAYGVSSETKESDKTQAEEKWETYTMPNLVNHSVSYAGSKTENWKCQMVYIGRRFYDLTSISTGRLYDQQSGSSVLVDGWQCRSPCRI